MAEPTAQAETQTTTDHPVKPEAAPVASQAQAGEHVAGKQMSMFSLLQGIAKGDMSNGMGGNPFQILQAMFEFMMGKNNGSQLKEMIAQMGGHGAAAAQTQKAEAPENGAASAQTAKVQEAPPKPAYAQGPNGTALTAQVSGVPKQGEPVVAMGAENSTAMTASGETYNLAGNFNANGSAQLGDSNVIITDPTINPEALSKQPEMAIVGRPGMSAANSKSFALGA